MTTGRCLCRAIAFAYDAAPRWTLNCHCETCRRATSSAMTTWICMPRDAFRFTRGVPSYYASSPGVRRGLAGALDEPNEAQPTAHVLSEEQLAWFAPPDP